jgi:site-specific recombinase XerD
MTRSRITQTDPPDLLPYELSTLASDWLRSLRASNRSQHTLRAYRATVTQLEAFLVASGMPTDVRKLTREHVESFLVDVVERNAASTAALRFSALKSFFGWLVDEGEITRSPIERTARPNVPDVPVPIITTEQAKALLKACNGTTFEDRRDAAILRLFLDGGPRLSELTALRVDDVDRDLQVLHVVGKGSRPRAVPYGAKSAQALDRYLRARAKHPEARRDALWLGQRGALSTGSVYAVVRRRASLAGFTLHPHQLRHTWAHQWRAQGGNSDDLQRMGGWRSAQMLNRYGASAADERAREAHKKLSFGDQL